MLKILQIVLLGAGISSMYSPQQSNIGVVKDEIIDEESILDEDESGEDELDLISITDDEESEDLEPSEENNEEPIYNAVVVLDKYAHGNVKASVSKGNDGDICTLTVTAGFLYKIDYVSVNGVNLIESEDVFGEYTFALVEGENIVDAKFIVDEELCAEMTDIVREAGDRDWENLFSLNNIFTLIKWILDGGILIAVIRYYVKDKKLEKKVENTVQNTINDIIPENTRKAVLTTLENAINPLFNKILLENEDMRNSLKTFARCIALSQENTPESKMAIIDELSKIKISDMALNEKIKNLINESSNKMKEEIQNVMDSLNDIYESNKKMLKGIPAEEKDKKVF